MSTCRLHTWISAGYLRSNGDVSGQLLFGGEALKCSGATVMAWSVSLSLSALARASVVSEKNWTDFAISPEKVANHASTESERRSRRKYLALQNILHVGKQMPMAVVTCWCQTGSLSWFKIRLVLPYQSFQPLTRTSTVSPSSNPMTMKQAAGPFNNPALGKNPSLNSRWSQNTGLCN